MITAVDTSVLLDIWGASPQYLQNSKLSFEKCLNLGRVVICPIVWSEVRPFFKSDAELESTLNKMNIFYDDLSQEVANLAGKTWQLYRKQGGPRQRVIADFLIAAHSIIKTDQLLTRDRGFYRNYFHKLTLIDPNE